jgi:hypothetical protein
VKPPNEFQPAKILVATSCQQAYGSAMSWNKQSLLALTTTQHTHRWLVCYRQTGSWHYLRELGFACSKASIHKKSVHTCLQYASSIFQKKEQGMHKQSILTIANPHADVILQSFEDRREQFRQSLISQNYAEGTIIPHIRCINVLSEAMKADGLKFEELDETLAVELIAKTGWMGERSTYPALIVKRFVRFLVER